MLIPILFLVETALVLHYFGDSRMRQSYMRRGAVNMAVLLLIAAFGILAVPSVNKEVNKVLGSDTAKQVVATAQTANETVPPSPLTPLVGAILLAVSHYQAVKTPPPSNSNKKSG